MTRKIGDPTSFRWRLAASVQPEWVALALCLVIAALVVLIQT